ncbi:pyrophosphate--fructose 6-phosphate 1-phosphotransferase [Siminovitchia terrae]|uniref:diphosphate--fructose-6-phosphate 1-phosphotransferase n=1 Tax=Siminovitchia terrae TaxID=1914933 RepID=UPI001B2690AF|nr:diphosphate--fructose-6-phosphate 1-phosphotransferase [Siminovitchia terrae]GIN91726.1 pyrophosphate--fructose 6-phosphate 1-phosphotransferase [Siminovitchia terrae]
MLENCMIVQSGGPTAVINNSMIGLIDQIHIANFKGKIYGAIGGIHGLIHDSFIDLSELSPNDRERLRWTPGAALGTCRHKLTDDEIEKIIYILKKYNIRFFFYIGGNGSMKVAKLIDDRAKMTGFNLTVIGIPKSIDNDLLETDHSPGYGSASKFLATSILDMKMDVASYPYNKRVTIIETMGRHTGWLAAACSLATYEKDYSQNLIYIPEAPFDLDQCLVKIKKAQQENRDTFIMVAEGIKDNLGQLINDENVEYDLLGRPKLGGVSSYLKGIVESETGIETRAIAPSIWQRSSMLHSSRTDVEEAYELGKQSWYYAEKGYSSVMVSMDKEEDSLKDYKINYRPKPLEKVAGKEKFVPKSWYDEKNNNMANEFIKYVEPLIQGEVVLPRERGLPIYKQVIGQ